MIKIKNYIVNTQNILYVRTNKIGDYINLHIEFVGALGLNFKYTTEEVDLLQYHLENIKAQSEPMTINEFLDVVTELLTKKGGEQDDSEK